MSPLYISKNSVNIALFRGNNNENLLFEIDF